MGRNVDLFFVHSHFGIFPVDPGGGAILDFHRCFIICGLVGDNL